MSFNWGKCVSCWCSWIADRDCTVYYVNVYGIIFKYIALYINQMYLCNTELWIVIGWYVLWTVYNMDHDYSLDLLCINYIRAYCLIILMWSIISLYTVDVKHFLIILMWTIVSLYTVDVKLCLIIYCICKAWVWYYFDLVIWII